MILCFVPSLNCVSLADHGEAVFSIPFPLLKGLQVKKRFMVGLVATFGSGIVTVAASVSRFATIQVIHAWTNVCTFPNASSFLFLTPLALLTSSSCKSQMSCPWPRW